MDRPLYDKRSRISSGLFPKFSQLFSDPYHSLLSSQILWKFTYNVLLTDRQTHTQTAVKTVPCQKWWRQQTLVRQWHDAAEKWDGFSNSTMTSCWLIASIIRPMQRQEISNARLYTRGRWVKPGACSSDAASVSKSSDTCRLIDRRELLAGLSPALKTWRAAWTESISEYQLAGLSTVVRCRYSLQKLQNLLGHVTDFYRAMLCIRGTSHGPCVRVCLCLCLSVSVTSRCSTKTAKRRITQTTPHDTQGTLVFWCQRSPRNSTGVTPYEGAECRWGGLNRRLSTNNRLYLENGKR